MLLSMTTGLESVIQLITVLFIFVFVLAITWISTRYIAGIQKDKYKTGNMELIETLRISNNKYMQIVRVGSKYYCMAVCKDTVTMLGEVRKEDMVFSENNVNVNMDFHKILEKVKQKQLGNKTDTNEENRH
ncbi:MAG: flagellar biosynthetic protein FliO [Lachnospiraceae bacterium]|nr:flagellar biosynthetic protein FliO [Lachnospiraceae bacterium]